MFRRALLICKSRAAPSQRLFCQPSIKEKCYVIKSKDQGKQIVYESQIIKQFQEQQLKEQTSQMKDDLGVRKLAMLSWEQILAIVRPLFARSKLQMDKLMPSQVKKLTDGKQNSAIVAAVTDHSKVEQLRKLVKNVATNKYLVKAATDSRLLVIKAFNQIDEIARKANFQEKFSVFQKFLIDKARSERMKKLPEQLEGRWKTAKASESFKKLETVPNQAIELSKIASARGVRHWETFMRSELKKQLVKTSINVILWSWSKGKFAAQKIHKFIYEAYFEDPQPLKIKKPKTK